MSWSFRKVGTNIESLKASVQAEGAPQSIKDEICLRIDDQVRHLQPKQGVYVESYGHMSDGDRPWYSCDSISIRVFPIPIIDTPLDRAA